MKPPARWVRSLIGPVAPLSFRLEKMGWGAADGWLRLQVNYDFNLVRKRANQIVVHPVALPPELS